MEKISQASQQSYKFDLDQVKLTSKLQDPVDIQTRNKEADLIFKAERLSFHICFC